MRPVDLFWVRRLLACIDRTGTIRRRTRCLFMLLCLPDVRHKAKAALCNGLDVLAFPRVVTQCLSQSMYDDIQIAFLHDCVVPHPLDQFVLSDEVPTLLNEHG